MEGSESEAAFEARGLNPQLFLNEVLNAVDELLDGAFDFCLQQASEITGGGTGRAEELSRGVSFIRNLAQTVLDKRMDMWEKYCLRHCFSVPEGFVLPKAQESSGTLLVEDELHDTELDSQLDSLREKLAAVGKESAELQREIHALEKQSTLSSSCNASIAEVLQLHEDSSVCELSQEIGKTAAELFSKVEALKTKRKDVMESKRIGKIYNPCKKQHVTHDWGMEDIQAVLSNLRNI